MLVYRYDYFADIPGCEIHSGKIPIFATQYYADYIKEIKGHETVWFAYLENGTAYYLLPFAVIKKLIFRKGYFVTALVSFEQDSSLEKEKEFLDNVVLYIKKQKLCDWIQQGPNWAIFNTVPSGSKAVMFGTYKISLKDKSEEDIFKMMNRYHRKDINYAIRSKVEIKKGIDNINDCLSIIQDTAKEADIYSPSIIEIKKLLLYFQDNLRIYVSYFNNVPQSAAIFLCNKYCTYGLYAGSITGALRGSNAYLFWEAIKDTKKNNSVYFDFVGARMNPPPDSKLQRIQRFKEHFGSELIQGYLWKMNICVFKYNIYQFLVRMIYSAKGKKLMPDIIDQELKK